MCVFSVLARTAVQSYGRCRKRARSSEKGGDMACLGSAATKGDRQSKVRGSVAPRSRLCKGIVGDRGDDGAPGDAPEPRALCAPSCTNIFKCGIRAAAPYLVTVWLWLRLLPPALTLDLTRNPLTVWLWFVPSPTSTPAFTFDFTRSPLTN